MSDDGGWEPVALAATRWTVMRGWGIPLWALLPVLGVPFAAAIITTSGWWLLLILATWQIAKVSLGEDQSRPREIWLGVVSGQTFADRHEWGGASRDPLDE